MEYEVLNQRPEKTRREVKNDLEDIHSNLGLEGECSPDDLRRILETVISYTWAHASHSEMVGAMEELNGYVNMGTQNKMEEHFSNLTMSRFSNRRSTTDIQDAVIILGKYVLGSDEYTLSEAETAQYYLEENYPEPDIVLKFPDFGFEY